MSDRPAYNKALLPDKFYASFHAVDRELEQYKGSISGYT